MGSRPIPPFDFSTLTRLSATFVGEHLGQRHADMLWKIQFKSGRWVYLLVLLEFQSTVDPDMALRMLDYTVRALRAIDRGDRGPDGEYPPLLPVVIYNGEPRWKAATDTLSLFGPAGEDLYGYLPRHRYLLLDLGSLKPSALPPHNLASAIASLEQARSMEELAALGSALGDALRRAGETELISAFGAWISQVLARRALPGDARPESEIGTEGDPMATLLERVERWSEELRREGIEKGRREGVERQRALVARQVALKFGGHTANEVLPFMAGLSEPRIADLADAVIQCGSSEELIRRVREA